MAFLTLFTAPKPFTNPHIATIQRNAIHSWTLLPDVDVLVIGREAGLSEAAAELGVRHLPDVERNEKGTPLVSSIFNLARRNSSSPVLCYINADILAMSDLVSVASSVYTLQKQFLIVGRRWDVNITEALDFSAGWETRFRRMAEMQGKLRSPAGSDHFVFPRDCFTNIPDFAIGRAGWDNWMIYEAIVEKWSAIDGTEAITVIHQNHDYSHLPGGQTHYRLPETDENIRLAGGRLHTRYSIVDAPLRYSRGRLRRAKWTLPGLLRQIELFMTKKDDLPGYPFSVLYNHVYKWRIKIQKRMWP